MPATRPTPSTWPSTKCPPRRPSNLSGLSRLTRSPASTLPSVVTRIVSGEIVARKQEDAREVTVRQTPLTATLSPSPSSDDSGDCTSRMRPPGVGPTSRTVPTASINPVNIPLHQKILAEHPAARARWLAAGIETGGSSDARLEDVSRANALHAI